MAAPSVEIAAERLRGLLTDDFVAQPDSRDACASRRFNARNVLLVSYDFANLHARKRVFEDHGCLPVFERTDKWQ